MKIVHNGTGAVKEVLERKASELAKVLRKRDSIAIEKSADQVDEIQCASERDLAIQNVDREYSQLREVNDALRRLREGSFGVCLGCDSAIGSNRLAAVPWALRCIRCQEVADRDWQESAIFDRGKLAAAA